MVINNSKKFKSFARGTKYQIVLEMQYIKFGSKLYTNRGQIEKHFQGDYDANCEKVVHSGQGRETVTTTG